VTSSWFFLSTLNYDARSTTHQIYVDSVAMIVMQHWKYLHCDKARYVDIMKMGNQLSQYIETTDRFGDNMQAYKFCIICCVLINRDTLTVQTIKVTWNWPFIIVPSYHILNIFSDYLIYMYKISTFCCFTALSLLCFTKLAPAAVNTFSLV
jgi:hypothetical protein